MFIYTIGDIIGLAVLAVLALIFGLLGVLKAYVKILQKVCKHDWKHYTRITNLRPEYWYCRKCEKESTTDPLTTNFNKE